MISTVPAIAISTPEGSAWEFLVVFLVVILGPPLMQRARVPGLIGLLVGGFLIGPHGLGFLQAGNTTIPDLGQLGLLYLMFVAGVELDLAILRRHRRSAITFGLLTFTFPMAFGTIVGAALGWELAAALLLGSLLASHTLLLYPLLRNAGVANDTMIASAVGATVLTDTLALVILAVVSGTQSGTGGGAGVALQIAVGLAVLLTFCFVLLPVLAQRAFRVLGTERTVRYVIAVASFLAAAVVAETFGIEGIVGAFFAGLAMNHLVPNEGPLMGRIDFFGTAVFVPVFLVSTGFLLDPAVMFQAETLGLAALFCAACVGGKFVAAMLTRSILAATPPQAWAVFALSTPQAAATLAATTVGFKLGLFSETVVNAVLVLILATIVLATVIAERVKGNVERPAGDAPALGEHVLVVLDDLAPAPVALRLARRVAEVDAGVVEVLLLERPGPSRSAREDRLDALRAHCRRIGIDADPSIRVVEQIARASLLAASESGASFVIAADAPAEPGTEHGWAEAVVLVAPVPVAIVRGDLDRADRVLHAIAPGDPAGTASRVAADIAARAGGADAVEDDGRSVCAILAQGELGIVAVSDWSALTELQPPDGAAIIIVPETTSTDALVGKPELV